MIKETYNQTQITECYLRTLKLLIQTGSRVLKPSKCNTIDLLLKEQTVRH
jgi:hypothetical protein